jgi:hypothetical protein
MVENFSEFAEKYNKYWVAFIFFASLEMGSRCLRYVVDCCGWAWTGVLWLDGLSTVATVVCLGWLVWKLSGVLRRRGYSESAFWGSEFFHSVYLKSLMISWFATWPALILLGELTEKEFFWFGALPDSAVFPATFYLNFALFVMLFIHSVSYFLLTLASDENEVA